MEKRFAVRLYSPYDIFIVVFFSWGLVDPEEPWFDELSTRCLSSVGSFAAEPPVMRV